MVTLIIATWLSSGFLGVSLWSMILGLEKDSEAAKGFAFLALFISAGFGIAAIHCAGL
jgi:hypothetical protein